MRKTVAIILITGLAACGGGGGGGGESTYSGTWRFQGTKVVDNCRSRLSQNISVDLIVRQDGDSATIKSGSLVATGGVNDRDGVSATLTRPGSNGCTEGLSIVLSSASDGNAGVGYVLGAECNRLTCVVGYEGTAVRTTKISDKGNQGDYPESLVDTIGEVAAASDEGVEGGILSALEETQLGIEGSNQR